MATVASTYLTFRLAQLSGSESAGPRIPRLPNIEPRYNLPILDEHALGMERLLETLRGEPTLKCYVSDLDQVVEQEALDRKGKVKAGPDTMGPDIGDGGADAHRTWESLSRETEPGPSKPRIIEPLHTWDAELEADRPKLRGDTFLSEASRFFFDALITASESAIHFPEKHEAAVQISQDPKELLDLMMRATLGSTMTDRLQWDKEENRFRYGQDGGRPVCVERITAASSIDRFLRIGTALRRLEIIVDEQSLIPRTPTHHALLHSISTFLTLIKQRLTAAVRDCESEKTASWNRWTSTLQDLRELAEALCELMCWPVREAKAQDLPTRASCLLTHTFGHLLAHLSTASPKLLHGQTVLALAYLLAHASEPFMLNLHQWVGLAGSSSLDEDTNPNVQPWADLGISRTPLLAHDGMGVQWQYEFSAKKMPSFIPTECRRTLFEAGRSLRLLRDASGGQHPLCGCDWGIRVKWVWGEDSTSLSEMKAHTRLVRKEVEHWRRLVRERARSLSSSSISRLRGPPRKDRSQLPQDLVEQAPQVVPMSQPLADLDPQWGLFGREPGSHLTCDKSALWAPTLPTELPAFIAHHSDSTHPILPADTPTLPMYISDKLLAPLLTHSTLVSTSLVSVYLDHLRFLDHLDVLRAFWLGGDVGFAERVSRSLFGKDEAGAGEALGLGRRARIRIRLGLVGSDAVGGDGDWGIGLGLGLSERQRWPPGGADLAYALRTTLLDEDVGVAEDKGPVWEGIEDRVSFAVRALPEDEADGRRARWMNPQAIEALDFLYLSYSPPSFISYLLPTSLMDHYQSIHNFLLRLSRIDTVVRSLFWGVAHQSQSTSERIKVGVDFGLNRPSSGSGRQSRPTKTVLMAGSKIEHELHRLRFRISHFVSALSRYVLDTAIGANWDVMRRRLERLKRRTPGRDESRPSTPLGGPLDALDFEQTPEPASGDEFSSIGQLQSIHSLVVYHHFTLDRILKACLLSPHAGYQVTFKILMVLFGLVLDLGKLVKEVERDLVDWEVGEERVKSIAVEWEDKEAIFLDALEQLSLRTKSHSQELAGGAQDTATDLEILLCGEGATKGDAESGSQRGKVREGGQLQELLLRLKLGGGSDTAR